MNGLTEIIIINSSHNHLIKTMTDLQQKKRLRLGILFYFNPKWMGGVIYIINLIKTLDFLDDNEKPAITLFYNSDLKKFVDEINYPYFKAVEWEFPSMYSGYLKSLILRKNVFVHEILNLFDLDCLYPLQDYPVKVKTKTKPVSWYADLQHKYYPEFFARRKRIERNARIRLMLKHTPKLILSSNCAANDFKKFFHLRNEMSLKIFHFVSVIDSFNEINKDELLNKYKLPEKYYIISNQFHKHKNHKVLLKALILLKEKGSTIHMAMTGRFPDASHSSYMQELHSIISEHHLQSQISLMGIIPRNEQLMLMKHAQAIIQPSLFEGWSTVIEDAISLQVPVIASNIPVNQEQLGVDGVYFDPHNPEELAMILLKYPERNLSDVFYEDYTHRIKNAARDFIQIFY
jgi:glycosyltransferase involved in cell wall biosynthesis